MPVAPVILHIFRRRWNAPVLARLRASEGGGFAELASGLGVAPSSLSRSLEDLGDHGWVRHREVRLPPYVLTKSGRRIAPPCAEIVKTAVRQDVEPLAFRRWSMPITAALRGWSLRFGELRAMLPEITPRALTLALKEMIPAGLVIREIEGGFPPSSVYRLTERGEAFRPALERLDGVS